MTNKIYGQTIKYIEPNTSFELKSYVDISLSEPYTIKWFKDKEMTNLIGTGSNITLTSSCYLNNDKIYANAYSDSTNEKLCEFPLIVTLLISNTYSGIDDKLGNTKYIDLDSIYFKFHKAFSGICYMYIRDIDNIYEQNMMVSDKSMTGSYNMYNEFDIIDEFFSNSHEVEVAIDKNIDLTRVYTELDKVILRSGTRVLLFNQKNKIEDGIYQINRDNILIKTDELNSPEKLFRYKVHVNAGTYLDDEFHVVGYYTQNDEYIPIFQIFDSYIVKNKLDYNSSNEGELNGLSYGILFTDYNLARKVQSKNAENFDNVNLTTNLSSINQVNLNYLDETYTIRLGNNVNSKGIINNTSFINSGNTYYQFTVNNTSNYQVGDYVEIRFYQIINRIENVNYKHKGPSGSFYFISGMTNNNMYYDVIDNDVIINYSDTINESYWELYGTTIMDNQQMTLTYSIDQTIPVIKYVTNIMEVGSNYIRVKYDLQEYLYNNLLKITDLLYNIQNLNNCAKNYFDLSNIFKKSPYGDNFLCDLKNSNNELNIIPIKNQKDIYFDYNIFTLSLNSTSYNFNTDCLYSRYTLESFLDQFGHNSSESMYIDYTTQTTSLPYSGTTHFKIDLLDENDIKYFMEYTFINVHTSTNTYKCVLLHIEGTEFTILSPLTLPIGTIITSISNLHTIGDVSDMLNECYYNISDI